MFREQCKRTLAIAAAAGLFGSLAACDKQKSEESTTAAETGELDEPSGDPAGATGDPAPSTDPAKTAGNAEDAGAGGAGIPPRKDDSDRTSKNGRAEGTIDGVGVTITYGRPEVRDRTIWGELVPYGEVWRTGANEATTITFDEDVTVEGEPLAAGTYALFTIPAEDTWTIIFNRKAKQWGSKKYDEGEDALRVEVSPSEADEPVEVMTFAVEDGEVVLRWAERAVAFSVAPA